MRELREQARGRSLVWLRIFGAASVLLFFLGCWWRLHAGTGSSGIGIFGLLSRFSVGLIWLVGPILTADCIARERREGTLGLLWLTPLRPWQVVAAKALAQSLRAVVVMASAIPVFAIPLLLGGVGGADVVRLLLLQISALSLALVAGLTASAVATGWWQVRIVAGILNGGMLGVFLCAYHLIWVVPAWWAGRWAKVPPTFWSVLETRLLIWWYQTKAAWLGVERGWIPNYTPVSWSLAWKAGGVALGLLLLAGIVALIAAAGLRWSLRNQAEGAVRVRHSWLLIPNRASRRWLIPAVALLYLLGVVVDWPTVDHARTLGPIAVAVLFVAAGLWGATRFRETADGRIWEMLGVVPGGIGGWIRREALGGMRTFVIGGGLILLAAQGTAVLATVTTGTTRYPWWLKWQLVGVGGEALVLSWSAVWIGMALRLRVGRPEAATAGALGLWILLEYGMTPAVQQITHPWVTDWKGALGEPWLQWRGGRVLIGSAGLAWSARLVVWLALGLGARWWLLHRLAPDGVSSRMRPGSQPRPDRKSVGRVYSST